MNYESSFRADQASVVLEPDARARRRRALFIAAGVAVLVAAAIAWFIFGRSGDAAGAAEKGRVQAPTVSVVVPGRQQVARTVTATGSLAARREMPVGVVGEGGLVTRVWVEAGAWVAAGQVLATVERSVQAQQAASLDAQIGVARANLRLAEQELVRARQLVSRGFISRADVDRRTATRDQAAAQVKVAQAQYRETLNRNARLDIRAPAAGLVLTRAVEPGQVVGGASGTLFRIAQGGQMEMQAQLSEADLAAVAIGSQATVRPVGAGRGFTGQVWQVSPVIDPQNRQGIARVALSYDPAIRPGGFASVEIIAGTREAPLLPESAILSDEKGNFVYVIGRDNKAQRRAVTTGTVTARGIAVTAGLDGTERVVLRAGGFLNPGEAVKPELQKL